ncbi:MAG TPA: hydroxymethylbilane synthase [Saprospiraceae bacterium]|nr:hydroxymethylbilane synthase [Saprospiraceae bacterium]HMQ85484.1 hydroxymethylbilane synthase [Saprospiraceae bacterium]
MEEKIRIGTRGSKLALWQAHYTVELLDKIGVEAELHIIKTQGDRIQHLGFDKMEGKGFFTKEIEEALLRGDVDVAVHSMKDLPTAMPEGLVITAVSERADPADCLLIAPHAIDEASLFRLKKGAVVGTSAARRKAQMRHFRPDVQLTDIRGNVPTRIAKLEEGQFDAIFLAAAGVQRLALDLSAFHVVKFSPKEFVPAPAQGVLAWQCCRENVAVRHIFKQIHQSKTAAATNLERQVLRLMQGGCQMPIGVFCEQDHLGYYHIWAAMADHWEEPLRKVSLSQSTHHQLAERVVQALHGHG